jgi:hypothetical protein
MNPRPHPARLFRAPTRPTGHASTRCSTALVSSLHRSRTLRAPRATRRHAHPLQTRANPIQARDRSWATTRPHPERRARVQPAFGFAVPSPLVLVARLLAGREPRLHRRPRIGPARRQRGAERRSANNPKRAVRDQRTQHDRSSQPLPRRLRVRPANPPRPPSHPWQFRHRNAHHEPADSARRLRDRNADYEHLASDWRFRHWDARGADRGYPTPSLPKRTQPRSDHSLSNSSPRVTPAPRNDVKASVHPSTGASSAKQLPADTPRAKVNARRPPAGDSTWRQT